jgi:hypothetical protein
MGDNPAGLDSPGLPRRHPGRRILEASLRRRGAALPRRPAGAPWSAAFFGLQRSVAYQSLNKRARRRVLEECGRGLLEEAYFIEKLGLTFASKMALAAETTEERSVHCLFAADEAVHLAQIGAFLPDPPPKTEDSFLQWLAGIIEELPPPGARLLVQILLEGWGINHYRQLSRGCADIGLSEALSGIARDEVLHHQAGVTLFDERRLKGRERRAAADRVAELFDMVRAGPVRVASAVERAHGGLGPLGRAKLMAELAAGDQAAGRLSLLRRLLASAGASSLAR